MTAEDNKQPKTMTEPVLSDHASGLKDYLDRMIDLHREGKLGDAQAGYQKILQVEPEHADALHMLGVLVYQMGEFDEAVSLITRARQRMPPNAGVYINLGNALQAKGCLDDAISAFRNAIEIAPDNAVAYNNLGNAQRNKGNLDAAVAALEKALEINNRYAEACVNIAITYQALGDDASAEKSYERAVELDPDLKPAAHMLAAMRGVATEGAPPEHVVQLFDEYAQRFDSHLVDTLGYSMPGLLRDEIERMLGPSMHFHDAVDLGCGTGLAGMEFRSVCDRLNGVDLSPRMIDQARARNVYDSLHAGDVIDALESGQDYYDFFVCADVFPYIGNIMPLFSAVCKCAKPGAIFAFSTEHHQGEAFILRPSGRYAHSQEYLKAAAAEYSFSVMTMRTENLRKQKGQWIPGDLVVLRFMA